MNNTDDFLTPYDDIAVTVVCDSRPNSQVGMVYSNRDLARFVCDVLEVDSFDIFETYDYEETRVSASAEKCMAYAFIAFLRFCTFKEALLSGVGPRNFNETVIAHSEFWYVRLIERWNELQPDPFATKPWIN